MESVIIVWKRKLFLTMIGGDLTILMVLFSKDKGTNISEMKNKITRQFQEWTIWQNRYSVFQV